MSILTRLFQRDTDTVPITINDWARQFGLRQGERFNFQGKTYQAYKPGPAADPAGNGVVFACESRRIMIFSEARFQFQGMKDGRPGDLFGGPGLGVLENPWPGATTRDLLATCELDAATYGNSYWVLEDGYLVRLDPNRVKHMTRGVRDPITGQIIGEQLAGYVFVPEAGNHEPAAIFSPQDIAHYKPIPSGRTRFLGQSWIEACLPDVDADHLITEHKRSTLRNGANLGVIVSLDPTMTQEQFDASVDAFEESHSGPANSGATTFLSGGVSVNTVGQTFESLALKATQGAGETRIAAAAGIHPVVVGLSEGMQGSSLNSGNYGAAKRSTVDGTIRPLWGAWCGAFQPLVKNPAARRGEGVVRLWYDDRDIPFLREDVTDQADIRSKDASTLRQLTDAGWDPDAATTYVDTNDIKRLLGQHTGLFSAQLQPPSDGTEPSTPDGTPA